MQSSRKTAGRLQVSKSAKLVLRRFHLSGGLTWGKTWKPHQHEIER